uniref:uncharacterized protein LOC120340017 n=1 Tax=Styela clava TaxID=7725 RepID=UPI00193A57C7|nr:uncharacterized protein LOC120340017 [Styela clava]
MTILTTNKNELESKFVEFLTNISARKLSQSDIASIGNKKYVENLLLMLRRKMNTRSRDAIFYNLLSLLAYLTAETPSTCTNIVNAGGITVFAQLLEDNDPVSNKRVLMNLSNLTDVPEICYHFLDGNSGAVECLLKLMNSDEIHMTETYKEMLIEEQGIDHLLELKQNLYVDENVKNFAVLTLNFIH